MHWENDVRTEQEEIVRYRDERSYPRALLVAIALGLTSLASPRAAHADAAACMKDHASAQREQKAGRLKAASQQFMACGSDEACPERVRNDCVERYAVVEKLVPTVILSLTDAHGKDVTSAQVFSNGTLFTSELDGRAIALEPGRHAFRFVLPSGEEVTSEVVVREGEKNRVVTAKQAAAPADAAAEPAAASTDQAKPIEPRDKALPAGFWIASGVGVAALASFTTFAVMGRKKHESLADCSPDCSPSRQEDYDALKRNYLIADISLGAAAVSFGVATVLFLTSGSRDRPTETARVELPRVSLVPARTGVGGALVVSGPTF
jgi:hypothetical protein